jgi:hypothetical protein
MSLLRLLSFGVLLTLFTVSCRKSVPAIAARDQAANTTSPAETEFASEPLGIRLAYPANWVAATSDEFVLKIVPSDQGKSTSSKSAISLDVPKLPPHIPGFIPLGLVVNGCIDDLKKQYPGVQVGKPVETKVAGATARRVRSKLNSHVEQAILTVHGDRVYIFRGNSTIDEEANMQAALDRVLATVKWK